MRLKRQTARRIKIAICYVIVIVAFIMVVFPLYWMFRTSVTPENMIYEVRPKLAPPAITFENYRVIFVEKGFLRNILNSMYIALLTTIFSIVVALLGSYAITRMKFKGRAFFEKSIISAYLLPRGNILIPLYVLIATMGLYGYREALLVIYPTFIVPYCAYMLIGFYKTIPVSLEEAAMIDGCTRFQTIYKIIIPIMLPGVAVVSTFGFTMAWNEYIWAMLLLTNPSHQTVMGAINSFRYADNAIWGLLMASSVIATIPVVTMYLVSQTMMVKDSTQGGIK